MSICFSGRRALILGGSCDLAICLAHHLICKDVSPLLTYRTEKGENYIKKELESVSGRYNTIYLNFGEIQSLKGLLDKIGSDDFDYMVDFAQGDYESLISASDESRVYQYFSENISFRAALLKNLTRVMLRKKKGRLIFISSSAAKRPNPGQGFYAAAKLASEALYRNLGLELGSRGITTITLRPGYIEEGRGKAFLKPNKEKVLNKIPIKRIITMKEVAEAIIFFLSENSRGFNATEIELDGGFTAGK